MNATYDLFGLGIGPFNLSLAALLNLAPELKTKFVDQKTEFEWHPEMMFGDSYMQTSYLKDLVTPVDPTSPHSFLNYLVKNGIFHSFMNTDRGVVSRREFELYCRWVSQNLGDKLQFSTPVHEVRFDQDQFKIETSRGTESARNICIATGLTPRIPACARPFLGGRVFHAKSPAVREMDLTGKRVAIIGGGQTGVEFFRNALLGNWGRPESVRLLTRRPTLEPLDESAFTNEYFTPAYSDEFWRLSGDKKAQIVHSQKLASDGNTPTYLKSLYQDLYRMKHVDQSNADFEILPLRELVSMRQIGQAYELRFYNAFTDSDEAFEADLVILSTGFESVIPAYLDPIRSLIKFDEQGRFAFTKSFSIEWNGPSANRIYALNFSRHHHGISEPQTSLMSWRSALIVNDLARRTIYLNETQAPNFVRYRS